MQVLGINEVVIFLVCMLSTSDAWTPRFFRGRPRGGLVPPPPRSEDNQGTPLSPDLWFNQTLNHFDSADSRSFQQRYFMNDKYFKPGGPVFLSIGGEGPANPVWMENGAWVQYAQDHKAMMFMMEHRYYGKTHPTDDMSVDNLQYLNSEQALADLAQFITFAQNKYKLTGSKWIAIGGSYSGALAGWFRMKYPHLVTGAIATSAPVFAKLNFLEYLSVVRDSLAENSQSCVSNIQQAVAEIDKMMNTSEGRQTLKTMFKLCEDINITNAEDVSNLYSVLTGNFEGVVQYNKDNRAFEGAVGSNITIGTLCDIMDKNTSRPAVQRFADVNSLMLATYQEKCQDFSYQSMVSDMKTVDWKSDAAEGGRQWTYQTCTEFGFYQTSDDNSQPFGHKFPLQFFIKQCQDIYSPKFNADFISRAITQTNMNYGGYGIKVTNVVFPNGSVDPWHALGIVKDLSPNATAIFIQGTAHCANMYPPSSSDPAGLVKARATISKLIGQWIA
ncbi:putative serine protease K12H4.7 [Babylonia areolata]|uniref:putative serine protease K12H4.7 n=1 Tax=Babylonia areolata TaxID=304850 RepID=UPI003FD05E52